MRTALFLAPLAALAAPSFRVQELQKDFGVVYAVLIEDVNKDGKPDVAVINPTQLVWWQNPGSANGTWTKHVVMDGLTKKDNVCFAAEDIDGDGKLDFAIGADWQPSNTQSGGSLQWVRGSGGPVMPLGDEPTLHRMRWADVDGDGKRELIVVPLHGRGNKGPEWQGAGARILVYWPRATGEWKMEVADDSLHIVHNLITVNGEIWAASHEGVHAIKRGADGKWSKRKLGEGEPGEIKLGMVNRTRRLATVEPWHGNKIVVYEEPTEPLDPQKGTFPVRKALDGQWKRTVIEDKLTQAHALGWADFDGDGSDELAVGWRNKPHGVAVYKQTPAGAWTKTMVDDGMAAEDLAVGDLDGDGRPEIVAGGRSTANVRIYWNQTQPRWKRHLVTKGFANSTAIAADFTGDGRPDVITNGGNPARTILYVAPDWKPVVLHEGVNAIHSEILDVDGDGDMDYIGTRYSPGLIFWLERPADPVKGKWAYHVVDDVTLGGVDGIHGLITGDVDGDGKLDLIGNSGQPGLSNAAPGKVPRKFENSIAWFRIPKNPRTAKTWDRFVFARGDAPGLSHYMGVGDVNGDGRADIAAGAKVADQGNWFAWWEQPKGGKLPWTKHVIATNQEGATNIHIADLNGDRKADFFASRGHGRGIVWYEAPDWKAHEVNATITGPHSLAMGDIDGDGDLDAVTCAKDSGIAAWFENDGRGNFTTHHIHEDQSAYDIRLVDMDKDGDLDVLVAGQASQNVVWFENRMKK